MICPDCKQETSPLTYSQHIRAGCDAREARLLLGGELPERTIAGLPRASRPVRQHVPKRNAGNERDQKEGDPNRVKGKPGRPRTRPPGAPQRRDPNKPCSCCRTSLRQVGDTYCAECRRVKARAAKERARGKKSDKPCARCNEAERVIGKSYCAECQREYNREYQSTRNGNAPALRRIK